MTASAQSAPVVMSHDHCLGLRTPRLRGVLGIFLRHSCLISDAGQLLVEAIRRTIVGCTRRSASWSSGLVE